MIGLEHTHTFAHIECPPPNAKVGDENNGKTKNALANERKTKNELSAK